MHISRGGEKNLFFSKKKETTTKSLMTDIGVPWNMEYGI